MIFTLINKNMIKSKHFGPAEGGIYLNDQGRKIVLEAYDKRLSETINDGDKRPASYRFLIRKECLKLEQHLLNNQTYQPYLAKW